MKLLVFALINFAWAQFWTPYHNEQLSSYKDYDFNYLLADNLAKNIPLTNAKNTLSHDIIGYLPYWQYDSYLNLDYNLLTQINYFSAELNEYGDIVNDHNWDTIDFISFAQDRGVKVKLCATLFGSAQLSSLLSNPSYRTNAIENLLNKVLFRNADGVDIDFELLPSSQKQNLNLFMEELSSTFHEFIEDPIITMATPAVDWSNAWDYNSLATITDGLFIMGYNYFYSGSENAGPVSPLGGYFYDLEYTVDDYINKTEGQLDKLILGLPYYGYDWPVEDALINSNTTGSGDAKTYEQAISMANTYGYLYDEPTNAPWISYNINNWQQCWYDDSLSISIKYKFAKDNGLKGVGIWALGYDNNSLEMWGSIADQFENYIFGDLNDDTLVNVVDIIVLVNIILENSSIPSNADLNNDNIVNIQDIIILVNIILDSR